MCRPTLLFCNLTAQLLCWISLARVSCCPLDLLLTSPAGAFHNQQEVVALVGDAGRSLCSVREEAGAFNNVAAHPREDVVAAGVDDNVHVFSLSGYEPVSSSVRNRFGLDAPLLACGTEIGQSAHHGYSFPKCRRPAEVVERAANRARVAQAMSRRQSCHWAISKRTLQPWLVFFFGSGCMMNNLTTADSRTISKFVVRGSAGSAAAGGALQHRRLATGHWWRRRRRQAMELSSDDAAARTTRPGQPGQTAFA